MALEVLALFHIGSRILKLANRVLTIPNIAFQPEITRLSAKGRAPRVQLSTKVLLKFNLLIAVLLALLIISFSREVIIAVSSREYLNAAPLLIIYCFSLPLSTLTAPITTVMKAIDQIRGALWCDLAWAGSYIILLFALGAPFGIIGVGAAHIFACLAQLVLALRISNLDLGRNFITQLALKTLISTLAALVPLAAYRFIIPPGINGGISFLLKIVTSIIALVLFTALSKTTGIFDEDEKLALIEVLSNKRLDFLGKIFA